MNNQNRTQKTRNLRRLRFGTASTVLTIVVIVGVILLNVIVDVVADRYPITWDLSADKTFTLSKESIRIAESLEKDLEVVVFVDESNFSNPTTGANAGIPEYDTAMREFYNALRQYRTRSKEQLSFQFVNPNQDPAKFASYEKYDVSAGDILFVAGERYKKCSMNDLYTLDDSQYYYYGTYTIESRVEKVLASNIYSLQSENDHIVQVLTGHEEDSSAISGLKTLYELNGYTFEEISITGSAEFNKDAEVMLIAAPAKDYSDAEIKRVQEWLFNEGSYGRHLIVYINPTSNCPNLYELLDVEYGITVTDQLLYETDYNRVQNYSNYYPMCDVPTNSYTPNSASTGKVFTPLARRLTTRLKSQLDQEGAIGTIGVPLTNYPETAKVISLQDYSNMNTEGLITPTDREYPLTSMIATIIDSYNNNTQQSAYGTVVVSGCPAMAYSDFVQNGSMYNEELLLDAINTVTGHENSVTVSNKVISTDTVTFSNNAQLIIGIGVFTVGLPIIVLIICLVVFLRRKNL